MRKRRRYRGIISPGFFCSPMAIYSDANGEAGETCVGVQGRHIVFFFSVGFEGGVMGAGVGRCVWEDSWAALRWAASAQDEWIAEHGDLGRLFLAGDSAGANIVHDMLLRASGDGGSPRVEGAVMLHPWFGGSKRIEGETEVAAEVTAVFWKYACPGAVGGVDDPRLNPLAPGALAPEKLGCARMLVWTGSKDWFYARGRAYYEAVAASAWPGDVAWHESEGEEHVFFLEKPECEKAKQLMDRVVAFVAGA
nr:unnamed protein product [Digitaria exilis]